MTKKGEKYSWKDGNIPVINQHSHVKHQILEGYLKEYVKTLCKNPARDQLNLVIVDGFSGGGIYVDEKDHGRLVDGSPFVILSALKSVEEEINATRSKPLKIESHFFFVDKDKHAIAVLKKRMKEEQQDYYPRCRFQVGEFDKVCLPLLDEIRTISRTGRAFFLLDQYGWKNVSLPILRTIFQSLRNPEVLLTFSFGTLRVFLNDKDPIKTALRSVGFTEFFIKQLETLDKLKEDQESAYFHIFENLVSEELRTSCGARFMTPFFISKRTASNSKLDNYYFQLLHFANHRRGNEVMKNIHWAHANSSFHYGDLGLYKFGYHENNDINSTGQLNLLADIHEVPFSSDVRKKSIESLTRQQGESLYEESRIIQVNELLDSVANRTFANRDMLCITLANLIADGTITIKGSKGERRLKATTISDKDLVIPMPQRKFFFT